MASPEARLAELGISLPPPGPPIANYVGAVTAGRLVFVSGHGPWSDGDFLYKGKVGTDIDLPTARDAARLVALNCLSSLRAEIGTLDRVRRVVRVFGMVNAGADFDQHPEVINGASDLLVDVFGDRGRHARAAVGMGSLPRNIAVEIEMVVEIDPDSGGSNE